MVTEGFQVSVVIVTVAYLKMHKCAFLLLLVHICYTNFNQK